MKKPFYITTTLPYVNSDPHIGFAAELVRADAIARARALAGREVFFNTGTDEHGSKIEKSAKALNLEPQAYVDEKSKKFRDLLPALGIGEADGITRNFIRTTDPHHVKAAQAFWKVVYDNGFIYKKDYSVKYCVGCELEKTDSELVNGKCPLHPTLEIEIRQEENYFFKFSAFQEKLLNLYKGEGDFKDKQLRIVPETRMHEIRSFVERGLEDFSISRLASKMSWGIPVPGDPSQVMYVWFDALVDYISAIGWPCSAEASQGKSDKHENCDFKKWWIDSGGVVQYCGKDNLRQQAAMWQAMLIAAGLPTSSTIVIDGFVTGEGGLKMSKSLGNTVDPFELVKEYGTDAVRYYCLRELHPFEDSPFTPEKFKESYNAGLANGIGNLVSRVMKMAQDHISKPISIISELSSEYANSFESYDLKAVSDVVWKKIADLDALIQKEEPFKKVKDAATKSQALETIDHLVKGLAEVSLMLKPLLPETSDKIQKCIADNKMPATPLFMRK